MKESKNLATQMVSDFKNKNIAIASAYDKIVAEIKEQLKSFPTPQLRTYIEAELTIDGVIDRNFYSPILFLSVNDCDCENMISFAKNFDVKSYVGLQRDVVLFRIIYRHTSVENTTIDLEDCLEEYCYVWADYEEVLAKCDAGDPRYRKTVL